MTRHRPDVLVLLLLIASLGANVVLAWRYRSATSLLAAMPSNGLPGTVPGAQIGDTVPPLVLLGANHEETNLAFADDPRPTVLYLFSDTCAWCRRNLPSIRALARSVGSRFRFVGVSRDGSPAIDMGFPVYAGLADESAKVIGLGGVPSTVVVSPQGIVLKRWTGAYLDAAHADVQRYFGTTIPAAQTPEVPDSPRRAGSPCRDRSGEYSDGATAEHRGRLEQCRNGEWVIPSRESRKSTPETGRSDS